MAGFCTTVDINNADAAAIKNVTAGTAAASKAVVLDASKAIATLGIVSMESFNYTTVARTATADGTGTGTIADAGMIGFVTVTSASANNIVVLPTPTPGTIVILAVGANGCELRSSAPATVAINGGTGATAESALAASMMAVMICESATSWKGFSMASDGTLAQVEAAA